MNNSKIDFKKGEIKVFEWLKHECEVCMDLNLDGMKVKDLYLISNRHIDRLNNEIEEELNNL